MSSKVKKVSKMQKKKILALLLLLFVLFSVLFTSVFSDWMQIMENKKETKELEEVKVSLLEEEASLKSEVTKLQDPDYVARYAREKYLYTKDGEIILKIIDSNDKNEADDE